MGSAYGGIDNLFRDKDRRGKYWWFEASPMFISLRGAAQAFFSLHFNLEIPKDSQHHMPVMKLLVQAHDLALDALSSIDP